MRMISVKNIYLYIYNSQLIKCELYHTEKHFRKKNKNSAMKKTLSEMYLKCNGGTIIKIFWGEHASEPPKTALAQILGGAIFVSRGAFLGLAPPYENSCGRPW